MKKTPDFDAAADFLAARARVLDRRGFQRLVSGGAAGPGRDAGAPYPKGGGGVSGGLFPGGAPARVGAAFAAYRNGDGGFGHALEPDLRTAASQPAAVEMALRLMDITDTWDTALVTSACDWLTAVAPDDGGATFVEASVSEAPHAPWWV